MSFAKNSDLYPSKNREKIDLNNNADFRKWLLRHAKAGLGMAEQAKNTKRAEYFKEVIKIIEGM